MKLTNPIRRKLADDTDVKLTIELSDGINKALFKDLESKLYILLRNGIYTSITVPTQQSIRRFRWRI